jgi:hypothetical protein
VIALSVCRLARALSAATLVLAVSGDVQAQEKPARTPSPAGARVYVISPVEGETVSSPVLIRFGLSGMGIAPAGVQFPNTGHHHLVRDAPLPPLDQVIPADQQHVHYGAGLTEAKLELPPGQHTLQLLLGDDKHVPHDPPVYSDPVHITVK